MWGNLGRGNCVQVLERTVPVTTMLWPNSPPNSSQLEPSSQLGLAKRMPNSIDSAWVGSSWIELAWIWSSSNFRPTRSKFSTVLLPQPTQANSRQVVNCYCYVTTRSYSNNWMVSCKLARLSGIVWPPADASFDFVTWLELPWVGNTVWPGHNALAFSHLCSYVKGASDCGLAIRRNRRKSM